MDETQALNNDFEARLDRLVTILTQSQRLAFLTGAGISTSSGIPDFRSSTGIYRTTSAELFSIDFIQTRPAEFYAQFKDFYDLISSARPNRGHLAIAELERLGKRVDVVTQNIDALHTQAGSTRVAEIHGTLRTASCMVCARQYPREYFHDAMLRGEAPLCECGNFLKPDVTFFGEPLPEREFAKARRAMWEAQALLIVGTSLQVYPAAGLPRDCDAGAPYIVINYTPTPLDYQASIVFHEAIDEVLPRAVDLLKA